jgi:zinc transport system substrate-binding protein
MKKILSIIIAAILMAGSLSACGKSDATAGGNKKLQIVTTIFPEYDWVMNVLGDNPGGAEVTMLLDSGVDLHSYQPTVDDILKISTCDLFIYVGGESDEWVEDALKEATNKNMVVINLLEVLGDSVKEEEVVEGMQEEHDHEHEDHEHEDHEHEDHEHEDHEHDEDEHEHEHEHEDGEVEYDEHVWLSLRNASVLTKKISEAIRSADPSNANTYKTNTASYLKKLETLDSEYKNAVKEGSKNTLLFGDRFPFRYLVDDYGLNYYAAFVGCSAETEASFETITFLSGKVDELSLNAILTIEGTDHRIAETIARNTQTKDQKILTMDSMQSTTAKDVKNGASYLSVMENNLAVLRDALK